MNYSISLGCALLLAASCGTSTYPLATSLSDLTFETRRTSGHVLSNSEITAIHGLLPAPDVGLFYHYSPRRGSVWNLWGLFGLIPTGENLPHSAVAISRDHSYRLVGTSSLLASDHAANGNQDDPDLRAHSRSLQERVSTIRTLLMQIRRLTKDVITQRAALVKNTDEDKRAPGEPQEPTAKESEGKLGKSTPLQNDEKELRDLYKQLDAQLARPGIIVARWNAAGSSGLDVKGGEVASLGTSAQQARSGFLIMGGIRVTYLAVGDDFKQMIALLAESDRKGMEYVGITTFLLQAQHVAYVSDLTQEFKADVALVLDKTAKIDKIDQLEIKARFASFEEIGNQGTLGPMQWRRDPFCFVAGRDLPLANATGHEVLRDWNTVVAHMIHPDRLTGLFGDHYAHEYSGGKIPPYQNPHSDTQVRSSRKPCSFDQCNRFPEIKAPEAVSNAAPPPGTD